jgi:predicted molibdopterin-dependent oxidoreductase YjgC
VALPDRCIRPRRKLYDEGTLTQQSPHISKLAPGTVLRVSAYDFDRLGVAAGHQVRVKSGRGTLTAEIVRDGLLPRGTAAVYVNQPGMRITDLIDAGQRVTHLRLDSGAEG